MKRFVHPLLLLLAGATEKERVQMAGDVRVPVS